jgi:FHS family L-fucose permease-like MFS transporter
MASYPFILSALFIIGLGLAMLQIAANPYVTILGPERTASSRLNLSQAFNSFGTTIGPLIGGWLIFTVFTRPGAHGADSVKIPYLGFAAAYVLLAIFFTFAHVPDFTNKDPIARGFGALKHPHTVLGMIAIFMYVGGEISTGSILVNFLGSERLGRIPKEIASGYLAFYWGGLMIGRFMGAFALSDLPKRLKRTLVIAVPVAAFLVILALPAAGNAMHLDWERASLLCSLPNALRYGVFLALLLAAFFLGQASPHRMLALFGAIILALLLTGIVSAGETAKWAILCVGLFCSVMWSNIFSLAIEGLGPLKSQASSLLVVAILGGAVLPPTQGRIADLYGVQFSFVVPMIAFAYIAFYGLYGYRAGRGPVKFSIH